MSKEKCTIVELETGIECPLCKENTRIDIDYNDDGGLIETVVCDNCSYEGEPKIISKEEVEILEKEYFEED